jgi:hypothetical protein
MAGHIIVNHFVVECRSDGTIVDPLPSPPKKKAPRSA